LDAGIAPRTGGLPQPASTRRSRPRGGRAHNELRAAFAELWCAIPSVVVSRTLDSVQGDARLAEASVTEEAAAALDRTSASGSCRPKNRPPEPLRFRSPVSGAASAPSALAPRGRGGESGRRRVAVGARPAQSAVAARGARADAGWCSSSPAPGRRGAGFSCAGARSDSRMRCLRSRTEPDAGRHRLTKARQHRPGWEDRRAMP
jgi:hypothetical protein